MMSREELIKKMKQHADAELSPKGRYLSVPEGVSFVIPKAAGKMLLDFLPYRVKIDGHPDVAKGDIWYSRVIYVHYSIGAEQRAHICPVTVRQRCPICDQWNKLKKDPTADKKTVDSLRAKKRELYNVVDLAKPEVGIQLFEASFFNFGERLVKKIRRSQDQMAAFFLPVGGYSVEIFWEEATLGTGKPFLKAEEINFVKRDQDYPESIIDEAFDLDSMIHVLPYEQLEKTFWEGGVEEDTPPEFPKEDSDPEPTSEKVSISQEEAEKCIACKGTGKSSVGRMCMACKGSGKMKVTVVPAASAEEAYSEKPAAPPTRVRTQVQKPAPEPPKPAEKAAEEGTQCPHNATFGKDCNSLPECEKCEVYFDCQDAFDKLMQERMRLRKERK